MPFFDNAFSGRPAVLRLNIGQVSQSISGNSTVVSWALEIVGTGPISAWNNNPSIWNVNINGQAWSGTFTYDFRATNQKTLASGTHRADHNADGTKTIMVAASVPRDNGGSLGSSTALNAPVTLATIPRASASTYAASVAAGSALTISTNRASTSFTHTLTWDFGDASGTIATGVGASYAWTVPMSLLNEIPNATSGTGFITTITYSGSTQIGMTNRPFTVTAPSTVGPDFTGVAFSEATAGIAANIGAIVQNKSKLNLAISGAAGEYGSTIKTYKITVNGQTINKASGVTPNVISSSGNLTITATVTDTRGRTKTKTATVTVLAWAPPKIIAATARRATSSGVVNVDTGTYIRANINATVSSLVVGGVQKNALDYYVYVRKFGTTTWTQKLAITPGGVAFNSYDLTGTYSIEDSWDVQIQVRDDFATSSVILTVASAAIFMHWDAGVGMGVGKYREFGMLDVKGAIYQNNGKGVLDSSMNLNADNITGRLGKTAENMSAMGNWNSVVDAGFYRGTSMANAPSAFPSDWYYVEVQSHDATNWVVQTAYGFGGTYTDTIWRRRRQGSTSWTTWKQVFDGSAEAAGGFSIPALGPGASAAITLTFPVGRFSVNPVLFLQPNDARITTGINSRTPESASIVCFNDTSATAAATGGLWLAKQMTASSAGG